jgi:hypothetical protein
MRFKLFCAQNRIRNLRQLDACACLDASHVDFPFVGIIEFSVLLFETIYGTKEVIKARNMAKLMYRTPSPPKSHQF